MKKILVILCLSLFILQFASAVDTEVKIKTLPFHEVQVIAFDPSIPTFTIYERFIGKSDGYGDLAINFSFNKPNFDLRIFLKKDGENVMPVQNYREDYVTGESLYLEVAPPGTTFLENPFIVMSNVSSGNISDIINSTEETNITLSLNQTNSTEESNITNQTNLTNGFWSLTGFNISLSNIFPKTLYYIGGIILLLLIAFFSLRFIKSRKPRKIKITKLSEMGKSEGNTEEKEPKSEVNNLIDEAEQRIKKAQEELSGLKKDQRIKELREKMARDKEEFENLSQ